MIRVSAPARLHFGLLSIPLPTDVAGDEHQFGGIGLMLAEPRVLMQASPADRWSARGKLADRALAFAQRFMSTLPPDEQRAFQIDVYECPEEHAGLGSGTALALSVAKAIAAKLGHGDWPAVELAQRVGRGQRSAIGIHGFERGGLIVDAGKRQGDAISTLGGRHEFPEGWRIVLARPEAAQRWHGEREKHAFTQLTQNNPSERLRKIVAERLLPALATGDSHDFGEALHEYNALAGDAFASEQGGTYSSPAVAELVAFLRSKQVSGVGQSSWGPTVFAVVEDQTRAEEVKRLLAGDVESVTIVHAANRGAQVGFT